MPAAFFVDTWNHRGEVIVADGDRKPGETTTIIQHDSLWGIAGRAMDWLLGQQGNTIALFVILGVIAYLGWYAINHAIPMHLSQIQAGYEKIEAQQTKQIDSITASYDRRAAESQELLRELLEMKRHPIAPANRTGN